MKGCMSQRLMQYTAKMWREISGKVILICVVSGIALFAHSDNIYVSVKFGNDSLGNGSLEQPYLTISKALSIAQKGDTCLLRQGIYREQVVPSVDGITIKAFAGECPVISGCDIVNLSWSEAAHDSNIFQMAFSNKVLQVFIDSDRMNLARFPNEDAQQDMFSSGEWAETTTSSISVDGVGTGKVIFATSAALPDDGADTWAGGYYTGLNGPNSFTGATGFIYASTNNTIYTEDLCFYWRRISDAVSAVGCGKGYIINHLRALDHATEWYWGDESKILYIYPPAGKVLDNTRVEVRTRSWGMDLSGLSNVVVEGVNFFAASVKMENACSCQLKRCRIKYPSYWSNHVYGTVENNTIGHDYGGVIDGSTGVFVSGTDNLVDQCNISDSWGSGIRLEGQDNTIQRSLIENVDWLTRRMHGIQAFGTRTHVVSNTVRKCAQAGIDGGNASIVKKIGSDLDIRYNLVEDCALVNTDCGSFYMNTQGGNQSSGTEIAYNIFNRLYTGGNTSVIYLDNRTPDVSVHHNLVVGQNAMDGISVTGPGTEVYNNTLLGCEYAITIRNPDWDMTGTRILNNLCDSSLRLKMIPESVTSNRVDATNSSFVNAVAGDYRLSPFCEAIDAGVSGGSVTQSYSGAAPDIGALELGGPYWAAGAPEVTVPDGAFFPSEVLNPIGLITGTLQDLLDHDEIALRVEEIQDANDDYILIKRFTFNISGGLSNVFYLDAHQAGTDEGEGFLFSYSTSGSSYTPMCIVDKPLGDDIIQTFELPSDLNGLVYVRVTDLDGMGDRSMNRLAIDSMYIHSKVAADFDYTQFQSTLWGGMSGDADNLSSSDDMYQTLTERLYLNNAKSRARHTWAFDVMEDVGGAAICIEAHHTANAEGDCFDFSYSIDGINYFDMLTITNTVDAHEIHEFRLPAELNGIVFIRAEDTDLTVGNTHIDELYLDSLYIKYPFGDGQPHNYAVWADLYMAGVSDADDDHDGMNNFVEFAIGGNPTNALDCGYLPKLEFILEGSSNVLQYVYARREPIPADLNYQPLLCETLTNDSWTVTGVNLIGSGPLPGQVGFVTVTNRIPLEEKTLFIKLNVW